MMDYSKLLKWSRPLSAYAALSGGVNAWGLGRAGAKGGFGSGGALGSVRTLPNLFWVGGTGNWSDKTHWATTSGGAGGAGVPSSITNVNFNANSGTAANVTIDVPITVKTVLINKSDLILLDNSGMTVSGAVTLSAGTLNTNAKTETWGSFVSGVASLRTLNITNSTINIQSQGTNWNISQLTNLTATLTGSTINLNGFSSGFAGQNTLSYPQVNFLGAGAMTVFSGGFVNLTFIGNNSQLFDSVVTLQAATTVSGLFTATGFTQNNRVSIGTIPPNVTSTITAASVALTNVAFKGIIGAGAATWSGTMLSDVGGNTNITFTTPTTYFWIGNAGNFSNPAHWSLSSGGAAANLTPLAQDTARFDANSFSLAGQSLTMDYDNYAAMDWTGVTNTPNIFFFEGGNFCGNVTLAAAMTTSATPGFFNRMTWNKQGATGVLTTNGVQFAAGLAVNSIGGTFQLADNFVQSGGTQGQGGLLVAAGTFDANNKNVSLLAPVIATGSITRALLMGSGTWSISAPSGTVWNATATGFTLTPSTSTIKIAGVPIANRTFAGAGLTYNNLEWAAEGVASTLIVTGANTFADLKVDADTVARTLTLPSSVTQTSTTIEMNGSAGNLLTVNSSTAGTRSTLSQAIGSVAATFLSLKDSAATGGATFAATSSTDAGNNLGWTITP